MAGNDTKPISPEDLARLDAMEEKAKLDPGNRAKVFRIHLQRWWPGIRATIAQQAQRIAELTTGCDALVESGKVQAQRIQTLSDALAAESAGRLEDKQRIEDLETDLANATSQLNEADREVQRLEREQGKWR